MRIIKHINGMFDVFSSTHGWDIHTRVQRVKGPKGTIIKFIDGQRLSPAVVKALNDKLNPNLHYQTIEA